MKLATFQHDGRSPRIGAVVGSGIVDLLQFAPNLPPTMRELINAGHGLRDQLLRAAAHGKPIPLDTVRLLPPIPDPPEFLGVGFNYRDHVAEVGVAYPTTPTVFNKQTSCITGPYDDILRPRLSEQLDYEGELGLIIGRASRNLAPRQATGAIFGYVVVNDLSVRDWQLSSPTVTLGKSFDTHGPFGPWIVTADEISNAQDLTLTTTVNGKIRQHARTADMIFSCSEIVSYLSTFMTLQPGTVLTTGTPAGIGHFSNPRAYLREADEVSVEISGLGRLTNRVVAE